MLLFVPYNKKQKDETFGQECVTIETNDTLRQARQNYITFFRFFTFLVLTLQQSA